MLKIYNWLVMCIVIPVCEDISCIIFKTEKNSKTELTSCKGQTFGN